MVATEYRVDHQRDETNMAAHEAGWPQLSLIMPAQASDASIEPLLEGLSAACAGGAIEVLVIGGGAEQSADAAGVAREGDAFSVRVVSWPAADADHRPAAAIRAGVEAARAPYVAFVAPDFTYPPEQFARLAAIGQAHDADIVLGSRYRPGARPVGQPLSSRALSSHAFRFLTRLLFPERLLHVHDPLSGLLLVRRSLLIDLLADLQDWPEGAAPALEWLIRAPWTRLIEVPCASEPGVERADSPTPGAAPRAWPLARQLARLALLTPSAATLWKTGLMWLLGSLPAAALFVVLQALAGLPVWLAWLAAIETQALGIAALAALNADHHARPGAVALRWLRSQRTLGAPLALDGAATFLLAPMLHSALAAFGVATLIGLVALYLLDTNENGRQVFYTRPTVAPDETMSLGKIDPGGQALTTLMVVAALVVGVVSVAIGQLGPLIAVPTLIVGAAFILQYQADRDQTLTVALAAASAVAAVDYTFWRIQMTNFAAWYIAIPLLLAELFGMAHMLGLQWSLWPRQQQRIRREEDATRRPVFILIPTVNEGRRILEETVRASITARDYYLRRFPHGRVEIVICNDGRVAHAPNWQEPIEVARRLGVRCVTREVGGGAKAGNIEHARHAVGAVGDALIVVFDADQVAYHNFLVEIIAPFMDSGVGWVQSGQYYRNLDNPVARWADDQQALFYQLICPGKDTLNAVFMCGTNLMIRASALDEIGGFPQDSVTEDFAASVALHARWRGVFLPQMLATGLGPLDLAGYFKQQQRWAIGTLSTLRTEWRRIFLPAHGGLTIQQRLQYALGCTHYFSGARDLIYVVAPLLYVFVGVSAMKNGSLTLYLWHFLPYWVLSMGAFVYAAWKRTGWRGVVIGFASFPALVMAAISVFSGRRVGFTVTRKQGQGGENPLYAVAPHLLIWAASVFALIQNWRDGAVAHGAGFFVEVWLAYISVMLTFLLWLAAHDAVYHVAGRLAERLHPRMRVAIAWMSWRVRPAPVMANIALFCLLWGSLAYTPLGGVFQRYEVARRASEPAPTVSGADVLQAAPYLGITGQTQEVNRDAPALERTLGVSFALVGRTINVADPFDQRWADTLSAEHAYPMLTLQFGRLQKNGQPTLDASLPAIANGAHDADLTRLARAIRAYGKPVLLTILPYADRNWSLNSAVANGSVPSDTPRAWAHVQAVFRAAGAGNVVWVWSPADPAHDQPYAPPPESIGFVAVSLTYTSSTLADDPVLISEAAANHPGKPLLVEVTTVQRDTSEARWMGEVATEVQLSAPHVAALLYFDGLPGESRYQAAFTPDTQALLTLWGMLARLEPAAPVTAHARHTSPPRSIGALRDVVDAVR